jgi:hypothetical protein
MGRIKSAVELALERTESVKGDRSSIEQHEARQQGKKLANHFLEGTEENLDGEIQKAPEARRFFLRQGAFEVLLAQLNLPASAEDEKRIAAAGRGLSLLIHDSRFNSLVKQLSGIFKRYLDESASYAQEMQRQYAPKLRQKEAEYERRGVSIHLDPFQDAEFMAYYNQNMKALRESYEPPLNQVREHAAAFFEHGEPKKSEK